MSSPVGALQVVACDAGLRAILWPGDTPGRVRLAPARHAPDHPHVVEAGRQLAAYFAGELRAFSVPTQAGGTPFQASVWGALATIPFGATCSYAAIARQIGRPSAARAVGAASGCNPLSIVVPCHRVLGTNGTLVGFAGGLPAKRFLLALERRQLQAALCEASSG